MNVVATERSDDPGVIFDPGFYATHGYPHEAWTRLRREDPVHFMDDPERGPFWAVTRYEDIVTVGRDARRFISSPGVALNKLNDSSEMSSFSIPMILMMDPPKHGKYRGVVRDRFTPPAMKGLEEHIVAKTREIVDDVARRRLEAAADGGEIDFVTSVAARLPLDVILELLGVPVEDRDDVFAWSNAVIGSEDPEFGSEAAPRDVILKSAMAFFEYFSKHVATKRAAPKDDLVSTLIAGRVDGEPLADMDILGFCFLLALAGNETTRNATSGALMALIDHPEAAATLRQTPDMLPVAVEEMLRWVAPIIYMARTAAEDTELAGRRIAKGDKLVLFYPSANRDESVFPDPFRFDITRTPNEHLTFGFGRHRCLGNDLARIELRSIMSEVIRRFPDIRLAGPVSRLRSNFVGGIKHLPVIFD